MNELQVRATADARQSRLSHVTLSRIETCKHARITLSSSVDAGMDTPYITLSFEEFCFINEYACETLAFSNVAITFL